MKMNLIATAVLAAVLAVPAYVAAQPGPQAQGKGQQNRPMARETLYGSHLMTLEERQEHQKKMWAAKTVAERQAIRDANRKAMDARAKERNVKVDPAKSDVFYMENIKEQRD